MINLLVAIKTKGTNYENQSQSNVVGYVNYIIEYCLQRYDQQNLGGFKQRRR